MYKDILIRKLVKQAGAASDQILEGVGGGITTGTLGLNRGAGVISIARLAGLLTAAAKKGTLKDVAKNDKSPLLAMIPGVTSYRNLLSQKALESAIGKSKHISLAEELGSNTAPALLSLLGAGIGAYQGKSKGKIADMAVTGAKVGGGLGTGISGLGALIGILTRGRTKQEAENYYGDKNSLLANLLIPGVGAYNKAKSIGLAHRLAKEVE